MTAGYSGRPAAAKLGVTDGTTLGLIDAPEGWEPAGLPEDVDVRRDLRAHRDVTVVFVRSAAQLRSGAERFVRNTADDASLWIAWPRRAGGHDSDVDENLLREVLLPTGMVDVKVAAIDDDWSGLKFVRRRELRGG